MKWLLALSAAAVAFAIAGFDGWVVRPGRVASPAVPAPARLAPDAVDALAALETTTARAAAGRAEGSRPHPVTVVHGLTGEPLAEARVRSGAAAATSGRDGEALLQPPLARPRIRVERSGFFPRTIDLPEDRSPVRVRMFPLGELGVRVVDHARAPVTGIGISYRIELDDAASDEADELRVVRPSGATDENGWVVMRKMPAGQTVHVYTAEAGRAVALDPRASRTDVEIVLAARSSASGRVVSASRAPVPDVPVSLTYHPHGHGRRTTTARDGAFTFEDLPPGSAVLEVEHPGGARSVVSLVPGAHLELGELPVESTGVLSGRIQAWPEVGPMRLRASAEGRSAVTIDVGDGGSFEFVLATGEVVLELLAGGGDAALARWSTRVPGNGLRLTPPAELGVLEMELTGDDVPGTVDCRLVEARTDGAGEALRPARLELTGVGVAGRRVRLPMPDEGTYDLIVDGGELGGTYVQGVRVERGTVRAVPCAFGMGRVELSAPAGSGARSFEVRDRAGAVARVDHGRDSGRALAPGEYRGVFVDSRGAALEARHFEVRAGETTVVRYAATPLGRVTGRLVGPSQEAREVHLSSIEGYGDRTIEVRPGEDFELTGLAAGRYLLWGKATSEVLIHLAPGEHQEHDLHLLAGGARTVTVGDPPLHPISAVALPLRGQRRASLVYAYCPIERGAIRAPDCVGPALLRLEFVRENGPAFGYVVLGGERLQHGDVLALERGSVTLRRRDGVASPAPPRDWFLDRLPGAPFAREDAEGLLRVGPPRWIADGVWRIDGLPAGAVVRAGRPLFGWDAEVSAGVVVE